MCSHVRKSVRLMPTLWPSVMVYNGGRRFSVMRNAAALGLVTLQDMRMIIRKIRRRADQSCRDTAS